MKLYEQMAAWRQAGTLRLYTVVRGDRAGEKLLLQGERRFVEKDPFPKSGGRDEAGVDTEDFFSRVLSCGGEKSGLFQVCGNTVFSEKILPEPELVICGGGHISVELAALADYLEFPYTVLEEREEFAGRDRFPGAGQIYCLPFGRALGENRFSGNAYYVIVTRGHQGDQECLEAVLQKPFGYVGMIGSRKKVDRTMRELTERGYPQELLRKVHAPIGLKIGGRSPKEIALSIAAELVQVRNREEPAVCYGLEMWDKLSSGCPGVLVKVVGKRGSAPGGEGSAMLVGEEGILAGTIGGGRLEYLAVLEAKKRLGSGSPAFLTLSLDQGEAASAGMWCGGEVDLYMEDLIGKV